MYRIHGTSHKFGSNVLLLVLLFWAATAAAQLQVGDNISMTMNGNLGYGYTGSSGNFIDSSHSQGVVANANLVGYYFHPNFVSFEVRPYFDRAVTSGESQSITRNNGIGGSVGLFGGSNFPGSVSYSVDLAKNSEYSVGGVPSLLGDTHSRHFSINWSELVPNFPHLSVNYSADAANTNLLSTQDNESKSNSKILNLYADYKLAGFDLRGTITRNSNSYTSPEFLTGENSTFSGHGTTYGLTASHSIPFGGIGLGISHSNYGNDQGYNGSGNNYMEGGGVTLFRKLSINETFNYTTNTTASLAQSYLNGGTTILAPDRDSSGKYFISTANLPVGWGLSLNGNYSHRQTTFAGKEYSSSQYGGSVSFNQQHRLLGFITMSVGFIDTATKEGNSGAGLVGSVGINKKIHHWETSADFNYYQNIQTTYAVESASSYGFGGTLRRKLSPHTYWSGSYRGMRSALTYQEGNNNQSDNFTSSFSWRRYTVSVNHAESSGLAVLNSSGTIVSSPVPIFLGDNTYVFNANIWGVSGTARLFQRMTVSGGYSTVDNDSRTGQFATISNGDRYHGRVDYTLRKFSIQGGFTRIGQDVSTIPGGPRVINSFYISLSRWFNVF